MRANTPSVTTSTRVLAEILDSSRIRSPMVSPTASPSVAAMRAAAARAARRRGSSKMIFLSPRQGASSSASGTRVVLPAPGGATSTRLLRARSEAPTSPRISSIGNRSPRTRVTKDSRSDLLAAALKRTPPAWPRPGRGRSAAAAAASSGPVSTPVSARRSGWNSARPLRPVAAFIAPVQALQVVASQGSGGNSSRAARKSSSSSRNGRFRRRDFALDHAPPVQHVVEPR